MHIAIQWHQPHRRHTKTDRSTILCWCMRRYAWPAGWPIGTASGIFQRAGTIPGILVWRWPSLAPSCMNWSKRWRSFSTSEIRWWCAMNVHRARMVNRINHTANPNLQLLSPFHPICNISSILRYNYVKFTQEYFALLIDNVIHLCIRIEWCIATLNLHTTNRWCL